MAEVKYRFDPNTLTYQKINTSTRKNLIRAFSFLSITLISAVVVRLIFTAYFDTPKEVLLDREREELLWKYEMLGSGLDDMKDKIEQIEQRDDYLYRPIFEMEPMASTVREAGRGGVEQFDYLKKFNNSDLLVDVASKMDKVQKKVYIQSKSFDSVTKLARNKEKMINSMPAIQPISIDDFKRISDYFGRRRDPFNGEMRMHRGMDFIGPEGTEIYATGDGEVVKAEFNSFGYGNEVVIDHGFEYKTIYAHLRKIKVDVGDEVKRGEVIGTLGNTGRSTGPHLHYEVRQNGKPVDPINYYFDDLTAEEYEKMITTLSESRKPMD
ncbi:MAG: M23 family metallopeptidase [Bacteroidales bacterium]